MSTFLPASIQNHQDLGLGDIMLAVPTNNVLFGINQPASALSLTLIGLVIFQPPENHRNKSVVLGSY